MSTNIFFVNGTDISTLGFKPIAMPRWADAVGFDYGPMQIPGRIGSVVSSLTESPPRTISVEGIVEGASWSTRRATLRDIHASLRGSLQLKFGDSTSQYVTGVFVEGPVRPLTPAREASHLPWVVTLTFLCADPKFYDVSETVINFDDDPAVDIPLGTLPSKGVIRIEGAATNPVVRYRNSSGTVVQEMTFTISLGGGDWLEIDLDTLTITTSEAGNPLDYWTGIDSEDFISPDPDDGDYTTDDWPTLEVTSGTGEYTYRKVYSA